MKNRISVIMPMYNKEQFVAKAIESVLNQSYNNFQFIIFNDASTDDSFEIAKQYKEKHECIELLSSEKNIGQSAVMNRCIKIATGEFIARMDGDDMWAKEKLQIQLDEFNADANLMLLGASKINIDKDEKQITGDIEPGELNDEYIKKNILTKNLFCHSSIMFRKEIVIDEKFYNEEYTYTSDYELWIRIVAKYKSKILAAPLVYYRIASSMISLSHRRQQAYFAIKAKLSGRKIYPNTFSYSCIISDVLTYLKPGFLSKIKQKLFGSNY